MIDDIYNNGKKGGGEAKKEAHVPTKGGEKTLEVLMLLLQKMARQTTTKLV